MEAAWSQTAAAHQRWKAAWIAGPQALVWKALPVQVGDPAPMITLADARGVPFPLKGAWEGGPALVVFLRHFACPCTWQRLERLAAEIEQYAPFGTRVYAIGQGEPERTRVFAAEYDAPVPILCDPERKAYQAFGVLEGRAAQIVYTNELDGQGGLKFADACREEGRFLVDSPWQLGAEFVINAAGEIVLAHRYQCCDDFPPVNIVRASLEKAARR